MESVLLDMSVKGAIVLALTGTVAASLRSRSAALRHLVWSTGTAAVVALPALAMLLPRWGVALMPAQSASAVGGAPAAGSGAGTGWSGMAAMVWGIGTLMILAVIFVGRLRVRWLARDALPIEHGPWSALATRLAGEMGVARPVRLLLSRRSVMPMMWGALRPTILLPREAEGWNEALKRDVILHELAHVARHDYLSQTIARLACALYWFNPLAWFAARRLRLERERACDDRVIEAGSPPCDYAAHLLAVARWRSTRFAGSPVLGMTGTSGLADRLKAILEAGRSRSRVSRGLAIGHGALAALLVVPLAGIHLEASSPPAPVPRDPGGILALPPSVTAPTGGFPHPASKSAPTAAEPASVEEQGRPEVKPSATAAEPAPAPSARERARSAPAADPTAGVYATSTADLAGAHLLSRVNRVVAPEPESCPESRDHESEEIRDLRTNRTTLVSVPRPLLTP